MTQQQYKFVILNLADNVAVALDEIPENEKIYISEDTFLKIINKIEFGHKFSIKKINQGEPIVKYGEIIGRSSRVIEPGEHVHIHNVEGNRGRGDRVERN